MMRVPYAEDAIRFDESEVNAIEGRRREVETRLALVRNFQKELCYLHFRKTPGLESESFSGVMNIFSEANYNKMKKAKSFWNSTMSAEKKLGLVKLRKEELEAHFSLDIFSEAVGFAMNMKTWKFWECCSCVDKFCDWDSYSNHVDLHELNMDKDLIRFLPKEVDKESIEEIVNGVWKPVEAYAAFEIIAKQLKPECGGCGCGLRFTSMTTKYAPSCMCKHGNQHLFDSKNDKDVSYMKSTGDKKWPLCDDSERTTLLGRIREMFQLLLKHGYLTQSHVWWVIQFTFDEFQDTIPIHLFSINGLLTLKVICFSGASQLKNILRFLKFLVGTFCLSENLKSPVDYDNQALHIKERVTLSGGDFSCLLMDKRLLRGELNLFNYSFAVSDDGSAVSSGGGLCEVDVLPDSDEFVQWLYAGVAVEEAFESWTRLRDSLKEQAKRIYEVYMNELLHLNRMCERKRELLTRIGVVQTDLSIFSFWRWEINPQYEECSHESLFWDWQKEPILESIKLSYLLEGRWIMPPYKKNLRCSIDDYSIKTQLRILHQQLCEDLLRFDAMIMHSHSLLSKYKMQLGQASAYDYRSIVLPLLKSFMQSRLEYLIEENDVKKADAATKTLSENSEKIASDPIKDVNKVCDNVKQTNDKSKKKKKDKNKGKGFSGEIDVITLLDRIALAGGDSLITNQEKIFKALKEMKDHMSNLREEVKSEISNLREEIKSEASNFGPRMRENIPNMIEDTFDWREDGSTSLRDLCLKYGVPPPPPSLPHPSTSRTL